MPKRIVTVRLNGEDCGLKVDKSKLPRCKLKPTKNSIGSIYGGTGGPVATIPGIPINCYVVCASCLPIMKKSG